MIAVIIRTKASRITSMRWIKTLRFMKKPLPPPIACPFAMDRIIIILPYPWTRKRKTRPVDASFPEKPKNIRSCSLFFLPTRKRFYRYRPLPSSAPYHQAAPTGAAFPEHPLWLRCTGLSGGYWCGFYPPAPWS